jgi:hypothetical protein
MKTVGLGHADIGVHQHAGSTSGTGTMDIGDIEWSIATAFTVDITGMAAANRVEE